mgnify:CR=1 FL=1
MRLSTRGRYAVMALVEMAARDGRGQGCAGGKPVTLTDIGAAQQLSVAYLEQLFGRLRRAGIVVSARGPGGGYRLARPAAAIPIAEIVEAADEPIVATRCEEGGPGCLGGGRRCLTHDLWVELGDQIRLFLGAMTLADVVEGKVIGRARPPAGPEAATPPAP